MAKIYYPGTYNPTTKAHENCVNQAQKVFEEVVVVPALLPTRKPDALSFPHRYNMAQLAFSEIPNVTVAKPFDAENFKLLKGYISNSNINVLLGADAFVKHAQWLRFVNPVVVQRKKLLIHGKTVTEKNYQQ